MADGSPEEAFLKAQQMVSTAQGSDVETGIEANAGNESDTDDYDPSAIMPEDYSVSFDVAKENAPPSTTTTLASESVLVPPPDTRNSAPLSQDTEVPSRTASRLSAQVPSSSTPIPSQIHSKTKGGFVVESDEEDGEEEQEEDTMDPYEPTDIALGGNPEVGVEPISSTSVTVSDPLQELPHQAQPNGTANGLSVPTTSTPVSSSTPNPPSLAQAHSIANSKVPTPVSTAPRTRLPNDVVGILEDRIKEDPRGDLDAWLNLIREHRDRNKQNEARAVYDRFFKLFPSAGEQWTSRAHWESANNNLFYVEQVFQNSLLTVPYVGLWSAYLQYVRRRNNVLTDPDGRAYKTIAESFDFALKMVGMDKDSGSIWQEYIDFLKSGPGNVGGTGWQDTQKMDSLRAAYQKAICVPTSALNSLWKEYEGFEMSLSKINGRKFMQEKAPSYMTARSSYTQLQNITRDINRTTLPRLPPAPGSEGEADYLRQVELWKGWIQWEKEDPLVLKDDEPQNYKNRVLFVYRQALMALRFWPEIWFDAAEWCIQNGMEQDGEKFLEQGAEANPESCLLAFKRADRIEQTTTNDETQDPGAKSRMAKVREPYNKVLDALYDLVTKLRSKEAQEIASIQANMGEVDTQQVNEPKAYDDEDELRNGESRLIAAQDRIETSKKSYAAQLEALSKTLSHAWIALMRAARRIQSKAGFRAIFADARKRGRVTSELYVETALIEYHCYKDPAGTRIFERGMKLFPEDEIFALEYLKHLIAINDVTNARAVFETTVGKLTSNAATVARAKPIFRFLHEYESHFGELSQVAKLEKRMNELYPGDSMLKTFSQRYTLRGFDPTEARPVASSGQGQAPQTVQPSIEEATATMPSPVPRLTEPAITNSPKRPFPDDFDDKINQPRKLARGESPLKGAAGRRLDQQKRAHNANAALPAVPLPGQIAFLLSIIPNVKYYTEFRFNPADVIQLLRDTRLPESYAAYQQERATRSQSQYAPPPMPLPHLGMNPAMAQPPYGGQYRY
ncbi:putative cfia complex component [Phaeomoniella chlamydospora]|uniref:mRNA 3'-end-processing protein RNA14 n=1 Tax=Phaeomoniella chlamydospora TaxID=158046 RepID=A0A0G2FT13_PHACM|nr:putative cfia complex component [Phaeomoniella chlamydospora]